MRIKKILSIKEADTIEIDTKNTDTTADKAGDVVVIDTADLTNRSTKKATTAGSTLVLGIRKSDTEVGQIGSVYVFGVSIPAKVKTGATDAIAAGDFLTTSTTAGRLVKGTTNPCAVALEAVAANKETIIKIKLL